VSSWWHVLRPSGLCCVWCASRLYPHAAKVPYLLHPPPTHACSIVCCSLVDAKARLVEEMVSQIQAEHRVSWMRGLVRGWWQRLSTRLPHPSDPYTDAYPSRHHANAQAASSFYGPGVGGASSLLAAPTSTRMRGGADEDDELPKRLREMRGMHVQVGKEGLGRISACCYVVCKRYRMIYILYMSHTMYMHPWMRVHAPRHTWRMMKAGVHMLLYLTCMRQGPPAPLANLSAPDATCVTTSVHAVEDPVTT
jgi:hypothetical protein